ncbi:MAG: T9SS type A sorting domain-containing protein [Bacteroidota bacterium]
MKKAIIVVLLIIVTLGVRKSYSQSPVSAVASTSISVNINGVKLRIPYYRNNSISTPNSNFTRAIITIHGTNRNADDYYNNMVSVATSAGQVNSTLIIAPQFLMEMDVDDHNLASDYLFWTNSGWKEGRNSETSSSANPRTQSISSYAVLDTIIYRIAQNFPTINSITITGHSAGGQVLNRYAASNQVEQDINPCMQYVIANPSSYLYMTNERYNTTTKTFSVPSTSCTDYDEWHKGFYKLQTQCPYAYNVGVTTIRNQYSQRRVVYLLGMLDNDPNDSDLDVSCSGMLQGTQRFERGMIYNKFLKYYYGNGITQKHKLDSVPNVGHDNYGMYNSTVGRSYLFNSNICGVTTAISEENDSKISIYPNPASDKITFTTTADFSNIEIYNATGQLLKKTECKNYSCTIDIDEQYNGLVFIKVENKAGTFIEKILIMH